MQISKESTCVGIFFNKVAGPQNFNLIKKRIQYRFFPVKFAKCLRTLCFRDHLQRLLLTVSGFQSATLFKKRLGQRCISMNFVKFWRKSFDRLSLDDHFLCLSVNFEKSFRTPYLRSTYGKLLTSCTSSRISTTNDQIQQETISQVFFKHLIQEPEVTIWRCSFT